MTMSTASHTMLLPRGSASRRLTRRSLSSRKGRTLSLSLSIILGVAFVGASFIITDSLNKTFDKLIAGINQGVDLQVRGRGGDALSNAGRDQLDVALFVDLAKVPGVAGVQREITQQIALVDDAGEAISSTGPQFGQAWDDNTGIGGAFLKTGRAPNGATEAVMDAATVKREKLKLGDELRVQVPQGIKPFTLVGTIGTQESDGFAGAVIVAWDHTSAASILDMVGKVDAFNLSLTPKADAKQVSTQIAALLPRNAVVLTGDELIKESAKGVSSFTNAFRTGLLIFAGITLFVSASIVNNVFSITIGQRLRELALLRAVGATGSQVRRMIAVEALFIAIGATIAGIAASFLVAWGLIQFINSLGGFPEGAMVLTPRTVLVCLIVGIGVTMLSVIVPARKASRIPPVAAMRPEAGMTAFVARRKGAAGVIVCVLGIAAFLVGLLVRPFGGIGTAILGGAGAIAIFLGLSSVAAAFVSPVSRVLGAPFTLVNRTAGSMASRNAIRSPRRTAATATALTIGVTLMTTGAVFANSVKQTKIGGLNRMVNADFFVNGDGGSIPVEATNRMAAISEFVVSTPIRNLPLTIDGKLQEVSAVEADTIDTLFKLDFTGSTKLGLNEMLVKESVAKASGLSIGETTNVEFSNGVKTQLKLIGTFPEESPMTWGWMISTATLAAHGPETKQDNFFAATLADGASADDARTALLNLKKEYPTLNITDREAIIDEFSQEIDTLLRIISALLLFAFIIALIGIAITLGLSVYERTREIGLMRAVGMDRRQVGAMIRGESVIVTVFGTLIGVLVGIGMGAVLVVAVADAVAKAIVIPIGNVTAMGAASIVAGLVASLYPSIKASRLNVLDSLAAV